MSSYTIIHRMPRLPITAACILFALAVSCLVLPCHAARRSKPSSAPASAPGAGEADLDPGPNSAATAEEPRPDKVVPAKLRPENERKAKASALYAEAIRVHDEEGFSAALPLYEEVLKLDPSIVEVYVRIYKPLITRNQADKAIALLKKGIETTPDSGTLRGLAALFF